ncbi:hypothetical protein GCM10010269_74220 [Streptomyces humidus]|uniref:Uncharacterized protein n=1 Tax=Streptomyces humidus TaxID=52259 RepID=A0A918LAK9_9ACTN|nr:hypothetical protein GCM10010269_74220 [Streptomyces humidus]
MLGETRHAQLVQGAPTSDREGALHYFVGTDRPALATVPGRLPLFVRHDLILTGGTEREALEKATRDLDKDTAWLTV